MDFLNNFLEKDPLGNTSLLIVIITITFCIVVCTAYYIDYQKSYKNTNYVGSQACQGCHPGSYKIWEKSKHSKAFDILEVKKRTDDSFCVSCHVLGWGKDGGFVSKDHTPLLKGVHCENCHGPRKDHIINPIKKHVSATFENCYSCHNKTHSPSFKKEVYWSKIFHGLEVNKK